MAQKSLKSLLGLSSIKVLELEGLAPSAFCGMVLSDYGADVIHVARPDPPVGISSSLDILNRGKRSIFMNLKKTSHHDIFKKLASKVDVIIDPYRPGVLEKIKLGPEFLLSINPKLLICRITGYGQEGPNREKPGHDLNYLADSGVLSTFGPKNSVPIFPNNLLADFGAGGMMAAFGILMGLLEREKTGKGGVIDHSITDSSLYLSSFLLSMKRNGFWNEPRGKNHLDSGAPFYNVYECNDGKFLCVGAIEVKFFRSFLEGLGLDAEKIEFWVKKQLHKKDWNEMSKFLKEKIKEKTSFEWNEIFKNKEACVSVVTNYEDIMSDRNFLERKMIIKDDNMDRIAVQQFSYQYAPSPKIFDNEMNTNIDIPKRGEHTTTVLKEMGISAEEILIFNKEANVTKL